MENIVTGDFFDKVLAAALDFLALATATPLKICLAEE